VIRGMNVTTGQSTRTTAWRAVSDGIAIIGGGYTNGFVPGSARGWNITVPGNGTVATPADPCRH
jgi:hypothetical protein